MAAKKTPTKGDLQSLLLINILATVVFIGIIIAVGHYRHFEFWLVAAAYIAFAYIVARIPARWGNWRWVLIVAGYLAAMLMGQYIPIEPDISSVNIILLLALFWLPFMNGYRQ
ncbi:MAG: hypothetical protein P3T54_02315 [Dehalogenimonas sp.]|uniref:Uncharacterized protein n=1 Tax=Candidatus Dehalogenimonas loeffleri TaxID=3127115 RepID=A0ABZ2J544_9CHLR|nr:hypothetical protein [Dehalogenimonas sp.]